MTIIIICNKHQFSLNQLNNLFNPKLHKKKLTFNLISRQLLESLCYSVTLNHKHTQVQTTQNLPFRSNSTKLIKTNKPLRLRKTVGWSARGPSVWWLESKKRDVRGRGRNVHSTAWIRANERTNTRRPSILPPSGYSILSASTLFAHFWSPDWTLCWNRGGSGCVSKFGRTPCAAP